MNSDNLYCRSDIVLSENERRGRAKRWRERVFETPALTIFAFLDGSNDANFASFARRNGRWTVTRAVARTSFVYSRQAGELDQFRSTKGFPESADETPQLAGSGTTRIRYFLEAMFLRYSPSLSLIHRLRCIYIYSDLHFRGYLLCQTRFSERRKTTMDNRSKFFIKNCE